MTTDIEIIHKIQGVKIWIPWIENFGILLYVLGIRLDKRLVLSILILGNIVLYLPKFYQPFNRLEPHTLSYIE